MSRNVSQPQPVKPELEAPKAGPESRGAEVSHALQAAQASTRTNLNLAGSAAGYRVLTDVYNSERKQSNFTNKISGVLVSGASMTPRIQEDGTVEMQTPETYTAKNEMVKPESLLSKAAHLVRDPDPAKRGEGLVLAVDAPLARTLQASNPELGPSIVKQNAQSPTGKEYVAMNRVAPVGDPSTGRAVFTQTYVAAPNGGQMPLYGFKKRGDDGKEAYLGLRTDVDAEGGRVVALVDRVDFVPGVTESGARHITRNVHEAGQFPVETLEQQRDFIRTMQQGGWNPITVAPPDNADLPGKFRGLSEVDVTTRAAIRLADAVVERDVIKNGLLLAQTGDIAVLKGLPPLEKGLVEDYAGLAKTLQTAAGIREQGVQRLFAQMDVTMRRLGELKATAESIRRDPAAMDAITEMRIKATELLPASGRKAEDLFKLFDNPEENFKQAVGPAGVRAYTALDNMPKAISEQLAKDLTERLGAWPSPRGDQWVSADGKPITFPDGSPRTQTPFDGALIRSGEHYDKVRAAYFSLTKATMNSSANFLSMRLMLGSRVKGTDGKVTALSAEEASALSQAYMDNQIMGKAMNPQDKAKVDRILQNAGPSTKYLDEIMRLYTHTPLVAAHRNGYTPAEIGRALVANAKDAEPWGVQFKSYKTYRYESSPVPSGLPVYIAPEQELPKDFNPTDPEQVRDVMGSRTWRVMRLSYEEGRITPILDEAGISTKDMIDMRMASSRRNIKTNISRKPLPENLPLSRALANTFNMPVVSMPDPFDGIKRNSAVVGMRVTGNPVATTTQPGSLKAIIYSTKPMVNKVETLQFQDENRFAESVGGLDNARRIAETELKDHPKLAEIKATLDEMSSPDRERGVYLLKTDAKGLKAFETQRKSAIQAMSAVMAGQAQREYGMKSKGLPAELRAELEAKKSASIQTAKVFSDVKTREVDILVKNLDTLIKTNKGKEGYFGFAPQLGLGNPKHRIRDPYLETRFSDGESIEAAKAQFSRKGLNVEFIQFDVENN